MLRSAKVTDAPLIADIYITMWTTLASHLHWSIPLPKSTPI